MDQTQEDKEPEKTYNMKNAFLDGTRWVTEFEHQKGDVVVATAYKSGTTWMQNIHLQLAFQGQELPERAIDNCPWLEFTLIPPPVLRAKLSAFQPFGWRQIKTHMRLDALPYSPLAKYIYVGRDGRDVFMSWVNHYAAMKDELYPMLNQSIPEGEEKLPTFAEKGYTAGTLFDDWISKGWHQNATETDGYPFWSFFDHVASWWKYRHCKNILFIHFNDLKRDLAGSMREVAAFLDIPVQEDHFPEAVHRCTFEYMKAHADEVTHNKGGAFEGGGQTFMHKGTNGRWQGVLTEEQLLKYVEKVKEKLSPECALWLEHGKTAFDPMNN